jgi:putative nucleotidyltransferase with HDIG domain
MNAGFQPDSGPDAFLRDIEQALARGDLECPTFVDAALNARMALSHPDLSAVQVAKVVSGEPLLTARVVAYANSAAVHRGGKPISDVKSAVVRIGQAAVRNISVALALHQVAHANELRPFSAQARETLDHGIEVAALSHVLALYHGRVAPDLASFSGLVHDLGQFYALWRAARYPALVARPREVRQLAHEHHAAIGAAMLRGLKLSEPIVEAVRSHEHDPGTLPPGGLAQLLSVANRCANSPAAEAATDIGAAAFPADGRLEVPAAQALLAEHFDEVTWLLAAMRG